MKIPVEVWNEIEKGSILTRWAAPAATGLDIRWSEGVPYIVEVI